MAQKIAIGTRVWMSTVAPKPGVVTRDTRYAGTVLRQNPYETTHYAVRLDLGERVVIANDSMLHPMDEDN